MAGKPVGFIPRTPCGFVVLVPVRDHIELLFRLGCYGSSSIDPKITPTFLRKSHVDSQVEGNEWAEPLKLTACEAFYLLENDVMELSWINDKSHLSKEVCWNVFFSWYNNKYISFAVLFAAYSCLKKQNWIVKQGAALGSHFALYKDDPNKCHSTYSVLVTTKDKPARWLTISRLSRVANQAAKVCMDNHDGCFHHIVL